MGIFEILIIALVAVVVIPPDQLPGVIRTVGKALRELRLASNTVLREVSSALDAESHMKRLMNSPGAAQPTAVSPAAPVSQPVSTGGTATATTGQAPGEAALKP